jgi:hypothetical protein
MKPDQGKAKDRAKLERKKAQGQAARAARKAARLVAQNPLAGAEAQALMEAVCHQRGEQRRRSFLALAELDRGAAVERVAALLQDADGRNREELARLLLWRGDAQHIDAIVAGLVDDLVLGGFATDDVVEGACERLRPQLPRLAVTDLVARLRRLGVAPLVYAPAPPARGVVGLLRDALPLLEAAGARAAIDDVDAALLTLAPDVLWARRHRALLDDDSGQLAIAGLATGALVGDARARAAIDRLAAWLERRPTAERTRRLREARLPDSAARLDDDDAAPLLRLCVLDAGLDDALRATAASALWRRRRLDAVPTLLLQPLLAVDVTAELAVAVGLDEAWEELRAPFRSSVALRDALVATSLVRDPRIWPETRTLVHEDPLVCGAIAARSEAAEAVPELLQAIDGAVDDDALWLVMGVLWTQSLTSARARGPRAALGPLLLAGAEGVDVIVTLQVLRRFLPRAGVLAAEVDGAIDRIVRRFALAREQVC